MYTTTLVNIFLLKENNDEYELPSYYLIVEEYLNKLNKLKPNETVIMRNTLNYLEKVIVNFNKKIKNEIGKDIFETVTNNIKKIKNPQRYKEVFQNLVNAVNKDLERYTYDQLVKMYSTSDSKKDTQLFRYVKVLLTNDEHKSQDEKTSSKVVNRICKLFIEKSKQVIHDIHKPNPKKLKKLGIQTDTDEDEQSNETTQVQTNTTEKNVSVIADQTSNNDSKYNIKDSIILFFLSGLYIIFSMRIYKIVKNKYEDLSNRSIFSLDALLETLKRTFRSGQVQEIILLLASFVMLATGLYILYNAHVKPLINYVIKMIKGSK